MLDPENTSAPRALIIIRGIAAKRPGSVCYGGALTDRSVDRRPGERQGFDSSPPFPVRLPVALASWDGRRIATARSAFMDRSLRNPRPSRARRSRKVRRFAGQAERIAGIERPAP